MKGRAQNPKNETETQNGRDRKRHCLGISEPSGLSNNSIYPFENKERFIPGIDRQHAAEEDEFIEDCKFMHSQNNKHAHDFG